MKTLARRLVLVTGLVQGVGFRPFVARLARELALSGTVSNSGRGVEIDVAGPEGRVAEFLRRLQADAPPMALVTGVEATIALAAQPSGIFEIIASRVDDTPSVIVTPDIATCPDCLAELLDPANRRYRYPFINCTNCGPRYSIIEGSPYDRARTSMKAFPLCPECAAEFADPANRRFHAQPNACPACGPTLTAVAPCGEPLPGDPIDLAAGMLREGKVVALLGIGGIHLACDAENEAAVATLRRRKHRNLKPLAVMCADLEAAAALAELDAEAQTLLTSPSAPILLLDALPSALAPSVAPAQRAVGVFLPYTPLHHLLFASGAPKTLVMTSGNRSDEPMVSDPSEAVSRLSPVADLFLLHDRAIVHPVDDPVMKKPRSAPAFMVRRARGFAPRPVAFPFESPKLLAVGAELLNAVTVVSTRLAFVGPHLGDLKNLETEECFRRNIAHMLDLLKVEPEAVACDLHPGYRSTRFAEELSRTGPPLIRVQHHEAHAASCMAENGWFGRDGIALALDGVGLGHDGKLWGGEIITGRIGNFVRAGHLLEVAQPGGDAAAREPWRMAAAWLEALMPGEWTRLALPALKARPPEELEALRTMIARGVNSPPTTSCGRLFDAAAALLGFSGRMDYTAQAPMELEALAAGCAGTGANRYPDAQILRRDVEFIVDPSPILRALTEDALSGFNRAHAAGAFHAALARSWCGACAVVAEASGITDVFLTGGCFQNSLLLALVCEGLAERGLTARRHREIPPNDGGISLGQAAHAAVLLSERAK